MDAVIDDMITDKSTDITGHGAYPGDHLHYEVNQEKREDIQNCGVQGDNKEIPAEADPEHIPCLYPEHPQPVYNGSLFGYGGFADLKIRKEVVVLKLVL